MGIEAVIVELDWLVQQGLIASYAIGGAVAAFQYIEPAYTQDLDVFVIFTGRDANSLAPLGTVWGKLIERGAAVDREYLVIGGWRVRVLPPATPLYDAAIANARELQFGSVTARVMSPEYLCAIALQTGRNKDYVRVEEFFTRQVVDRRQLMALVERFRIADRWKVFETRFLSPNA